MVRKELKTSIAPKKKLGKRLTMGFAGMMAAAVVGTAGVAAASPAKTMYLPDKATCNTQWKVFKFKSKAECKAYWDAHKKQNNGPQHANGQGGVGGAAGYGGISTGVNVVVNGNNNVVTVIINFFRS